MAAIKRFVEKIVALYVRLSRDDENEGDSNSIAHQIEILTRYAKEHGITNYKIYKDDGYSGTNFNRPGFLEMLADIEAGMICGAPGDEPWTYHIPQKFLFQCRTALRTNPRKRSPPYPLRHLGLSKRREQADGQGMEV